MLAKRLLISCLCLGVIAGCATDGTPPPETPEATEPAVAPASQTVQDARVTYAASGPLGTVVRTINEQTGGGLVLMAGLENRPVEAIDFGHATLQEVAQGLAAATGTAVQVTPNYYFIYQPGYEPLTEFSLLDRTNERYDDIFAELTFGQGTDLFTVLRWISQGLGVTVVADQPVAAAKVGEVGLGEVSLREGLEAVLKSARVASIGVKSTEDYIFLYAAGRQLPDSTLLQADRMEANKRRFLLNRVSLQLPEPPTDPGQLEVAFGALPIHELVGVLGEQLGAPIAVQRSMQTLPVNPMAMNNVTVADAMDLLIWQWPVDRYGYQVTEDRIVLRER